MTAFHPNTLRGLRRQLAALQNEHRTALAIFGDPHFEPVANAARLAAYMARLIAFAENGDRADRADLARNHEKP